MTMEKTQDQPMLNVLDAIPARGELKVSGTFFRRYPGPPYLFHFFAVSPSRLQPSTGYMLSKAGLFVTREINIDASAESVWNDNVIARAAGPRQSLGLLSERDCRGI